MLFSSFSCSGVDIAGILESYNFSETIINHLRNSSLGHIAVAYFLVNLHHFYNFYDHRKSNEL